jgi:predicted DNA-binding protein (UPF0251 family)
MPRPPKCRRISREYGISFFGPKGIPLRELEMLALTHVEVEALRLADLEGRYLEDSAQAMGVSRRTFARMLSSARRKMAEALIAGKGIQVEGGTYVIGNKPFECRHWKGRHRWHGGRQ